MTRQQAVDEYLDSIKDIESMKRDKVARRCGFIDFIDYLQKDGRITKLQAATWEGLKV